MWREALGGAIAAAFVQEDATGVPVYPREPRRASDGAGVDAPAPVANCPSCRRSVTPQRGELGAECPRCHGLLITAKLPPAHRAPRPASKPQSRAEVANQVGERLLEEYRDRITTVAEFAELHHAVTDVVAEATVVDAELADRRENARHWRRELPGVAGLIGG